MPPGLAPRGLATQGARRRRKPLGDRRGLVVDDVEDTPRSALDRGHRRLCRVLDMDEGPHAGPTAHHWKLPLADHLEELAAWGHRGAGAVEAAVAQHDTLGPPRARDRVLQVLDG